MYLMHHGVKGMKWGIRRYQNPDGTLTDLGRSRYYNSNGHLSKQGLLYNKKKSKAFQRYKESTAHNVSVVNRDFDSEVKRFKNLKEQDRAIAISEEKKWMSGKDYKGLDYYQFKKERSRRFLNSPNTKELSESKNRIRSMVDDAAKGHPLYSKNYKRLKGFNYVVYAKNLNLPISDLDSDFEEVSYGKEVVNSIMNEIEYSN